MDISNVNETHIHHSSPRIDSAQRRQKIVEILAGTANECLSELGMFPGMPQRLKELEDLNQQWRLENMKLYQDNASLLDVIHQQNERLRDVRTPHSEQVNRILELHTELHKTRTQRDELARIQSANNSSPSQLQQNFTQLQADYIRVITSYRAMCAQVERLQGQVQTLAARCQSQSPQITQTQHHLQYQPQQQSQQQTRPQVQQHLQSRSPHQPQPIHVQHPQSNRPAQRQPAPILPPNVQRYIQQYYPQPVPAVPRPQQGQQTSIQSVFVHQQEYPLLQTQQAISEQRYQAILQSQESKPQPSLGSTPGTSTRSGQDSSVSMANLLHHPPVSSGGQASSIRPNSKPPHSNGSRAAQFSSSTASTIPEPFATLPRTSLPSNSGPPTPVVPSHSPLDQLFFEPPSSSFNLGLQKIVTPPVPSTPTELSQPNTSTSTALAITPQSSLMLSPVKDVQGFNTNSPGAETNPPVKSLTASQPVNNAPGLPAPYQTNSLKRESPTESEGHQYLMEQLQKKPRLEGSQLEPTTNTPIEPAADDTENTVQMDIDEDEDIEVGPDGLRLVKDCISDLFGEEDEGEGEGRYCKLCIARRTMGYRSDSPKPFVNATNDELQAHCMSEHAEAWDTLRHSV